MPRQPFRCPCTCPPKARALRLPAAREGVRTALPGTRFSQEESRVQSFPHKHPRPLGRFYLGHTPSPRACCAICSKAVTTSAIPPGPSPISDKHLVGSPVARLSSSQAVRGVTPGLPGDTSYGPSLTAFPLRSKKLGVAHLLDRFLPFGFDRSLPVGLLPRSDEKASCRKHRFTSPPCP